MFMGLIAAAIRRKYGPDAASADPEAELHRWLREPAPDAAKV
jgi:hypothetical protein